MSDERLQREFRYSTEEITVVWKPWLCVHSSRCWQGLPKVFHPWQRPWITVSEEDAAEIISQVSRCPSGALSIEFPEDKKEEEGT